MAARPFMKCLWSLLLLASVVRAFDDNLQLLNEVVDWVNANGGWMSDKIEIRPIGSDGLSGIFAKEALQKGESVLNVPWKLILKPPQPNSHYCDKLEKVRLAITSEEKNPYQRYLATRTHSKPPHYWSPAGKRALQELMQDFPVSEKPLDVDQKQIASNVCGAHEPDETHMDAMMLLQTRGEGKMVDYLVPIGDLLNHRNGHHTNVDPEMIPGERYEIKTLRAVQPGEQLQNSYNQCQWCRLYRNPKAEHGFHVTPQLFQVYGFVELMPQRWVLPQQRLFFDIDETPEGQVEATFVVKPSREGLHHMRRRLDQLLAFQRRHQHRTDLPQNESEALLSFRAAMEQAFRLALEEAEEEDLASEYVWKMPINKWYWEYD